MTITEFAKIYNVNISTVSRYIKRHMDILQKHMHKQGNTIHLDEDAIAYLKQQYAPKTPSKENTYYDSVSSDLSEIISLNKMILGELHNLRQKTQIDMIQDQIEKNITASEINPDRIMKLILEKRQLLNTTNNTQESKQETSDNFHQ